MLSRFTALCLLAVLVAGTPAASLIIAAPPEADAESKKSVDQQLLDDDPATAKPAPKPADEPSKALPADHPLAKLVGEMRQTRQLLAERRSDALTQRKQQQIADALAALLQQAQKSQRTQPKPGSQQQAAAKPGDKKPGGNTGSTGAAKDNPKAKESTERHGPAANVARPDVAELRSTLKDRWGHLPANVYEEVIQAARGKFLTQYEIDIEKYFQRLLEQRDGAKR
jgi:hypothetical protein